MKNIFSFHRKDEEESVTTNTAAAATESDPLLLVDSHQRTGIRARRSSPVTTTNNNNNNSMNNIKDIIPVESTDELPVITTSSSYSDEVNNMQRNTNTAANPITNYQSIQDDVNDEIDYTSNYHRPPQNTNSNNSVNSSVGGYSNTEDRQPPHHHSFTRKSSNSSSASSGSNNSRDNNNGNNKYNPTRRRSQQDYIPIQQQQRQQQQQNNNNNNDEEAPPLLEIPEEIYAVRKAALKVLKPLTKTWVVISVGFALTVLFGMARWTRLLPRIPFWFIILPCWSAHVGLLWLHILSAKALSTFIADANESRQRPDSRDHLNRTEYLPLLQRSLKFGLKTGLLSFCIFIFEILIYIRVARGTISLATAFIPLWILVIAGIIDGLICKTQHILRVICWILTFMAMIMTVLKVDYGWNTIRWRVVVSPVVTVLSIASCSLIYIVYGHQIGYYRLTESQLTAGNLYSLAALICIVLIVMIGEVIPLSRPVEVETRLFVVILAPLVVSLVGMGAWVVSRDEFGRLLLYGGQSAVHPMKLKWENNIGWTSVQGKGVTIIPMFGEVSFEPLEKKPIEHAIELFTCCISCYPYEDDDENNETIHLQQNTNMNQNQNNQQYHPYLDSSNRKNTREGNITTTTPYRGTI